MNLDALDRGRIIEVQQGVDFAISAGVGCQRDVWLGSINIDTQLRFQWISGRCVSVLINRSRREPNQPITTPFVFKLFYRWRFSIKQFPLGSRTVG